MQRKFVFIITLMVLITIANFQPVMADNEIKVIVNGEKINFDQQPEIVNDRVMVPVRAIAEKLGARVSFMNVGSPLILINAGEKIIVFKPGKDYAMIDDKKNTIDSPAIIKNDRTLVPIRFVVEGIGIDIKWEPIEKAVYVNGIVKQISKTMQNEAAEFKISMPIVTNWLKFDLLVKALSGGNFAPPQFPNKEGRQTLEYFYNDDFKASLNIFYNNNNEKLENSYYINKNIGVIEKQIKEKVEVDSETTNISLKNCWTEKLGDYNFVGYDVVITTKKVNAVQNVRYYILHNGSYDVGLILNSYSDGVERFEKGIKYMLANISLKNK